MNKKIIKRLSTFILASGSLAGGAYVAYEFATQNHSKSMVSSTNTDSLSKGGATHSQVESILPTVDKVSGPTISTIESVRPDAPVAEKTEQLASFSVSPLNTVTNTFALTIHNADTTKGEVTFANGKTTQEFTIGEEIFINVNILNEEYTIQSVRVHSGSNVNANGVGNNNLGVYKHSEQKYSFTLPAETLDNGEPNPFYDGNHNISVDVQWTLKQINAWTYDWMDGTDSGNYMLNLEEDYIFDDEANTKLQMVAPEGSDNTIYRIYMNGHNMQIKNMTIPSGVQLMFINNKANTATGKLPVVSLTKDTTFTEYKVHGAIGRWGSCEFSDELLTVLNLNVYRGWWS